MFVVRSRFDCLFSANVTRRNECTTMEKAIRKPWRHVETWHSIFIRTNPFHEKVFLDRYIVVRCITCYFTVLIYQLDFCQQIRIICSLLACHTNANGFVMLKHCRVCVFVGEYLPFQFAPVPIYIVRKVFYLHGNDKHDLPLDSSLKNFAALHLFHRLDCTQTCVAIESHCRDCIFRCLVSDNKWCNFLKFIN